MRVVPFLLALLGLDMVVMFSAASLAHHPGEIAWTVAEVSLAVGIIILGLLFGALLVIAALDFWREGRS